MTKQLKISDNVYDDLNELKEEGEHTSFDSLLRELVMTYNLAGGMCVSDGHVLVDPKGDIDPPEGMVALRELLTPSQTSA